MKKVVFSLFLLLLQAHAWCQQPARDSAFADFHIHTGFKHINHDFITTEDIYIHRSDIAYLRGRYGRMNWQPFVNDATARNAGAVSTVKNYNQADFASLVNTPGSIFCTSLYPYEKQFALTKLNRKISNKKVTGISTARLEVIGSDNSNPMQEFLAEYAFLQAQETIDPIGNIFSIELARDGADLSRILSKKNASAQVISIEGGQVLYGSYAGARARVKEVTCDANCQREIFDNIRLLRNLPHKVLFITLAHFTDNRVSGFAKTLDRPGVRRWLKLLSKSSGFRAKFFTKFGEGIHGDFDYGRFDKCNCKGLLIDNVKHPYTVNVNKVPMPYTFQSAGYKNTPPADRQGMGREIIEALLKPDSAGSKRILIDVKHFDVQARFEFYALAKMLETKYNMKVPLIASHVAMSGEKLPVAMATGLNPMFDKYQEIEDPLAYYRKQENKYNGDWLCRTKNLLQPDRNKFFLSAANVPLQFNPFKGNINPATAGWFYPWSINLCDEEIKIIYDGNGIIGLNFDERILGGGMLNYTASEKSRVKQGYDSLRRVAHVFQTPAYPGYNFEEYYKCEPLLRNIFYVVLRSGRQDNTAWDKVAIGSDFDGLIDPIDIAPTALHIAAFRQKMVTYMEIFWLLHKGDAMFEGSDLLFGNTMTYKRASDKFFYENGRKFILDNF